jgi:hypothetical protein
VGANQKSPRGGLESRLKTVKVKALGASSALTCANTQNDDKDHDEGTEDVAVPPQQQQHYVCSSAGCLLASFPTDSFQYWYVCLKD